MCRWLDDAIVIDIGRTILFKYYRDKSKIASLMMMKGGNLRSDRITQIQKKHTEHRRRKV